MISDHFIHLNITFKNTVFLFHPSKLEMGLQGHPANMQLMLQETAKLFLPVTLLVSYSYGNAWEFQLLPVLANTWYCRYFFLAI